MPSGRRHDSITLWSLPLIVGISFERTGNGTLTLLVSGGFLFSGLMFGPDLDIYSRQYQRWGPLRWIWLPYRRYLRHRSFWSHGPVVGTAGRVLYLLAWLGISGLAIAITGAIAATFFSRLPDWQQAWQQSISGVSQWLGHSIQQNASHWIALLIGLELGAISHALADWLGSAYQRLRRPQRKAARLVISPPPAARPIPPRAVEIQPVVPPLAPAARPPTGAPASPREPQLPAFGRWLRRSGN